jgi:hypothetical protein
MIDAFFWWSGAIFWSIWLGLLLTAFGNVIFQRKPERQAAAGQKE